MACTKKINRLKGESAEDYLTRYIFNEEANGLYGSALIWQDYDSIYDETSVYGSYKPITLKELANRIFTVSIDFRGSPMIHYLDMRHDPHSFQKYEVCPYLISCRE